MLCVSVHILSESSCHVYSCVFNNESFQNILEPHLKYVKVQFSRVSVFFFQPTNVLLAKPQTYSLVSSLKTKQNPVSVDLPEQWLKGNGSFYVFSYHNKTWSSSRKHCQDLGGDLVFINNTEEKVHQNVCIIPTLCMFLKEQM